MKNPKVAFKWDLLGSRKWVGELTDRLPIRPINRPTSSYKVIPFKDITIKHCNKFIDLTGLPETPVTQVKMDRITTRESKELINVQDVDGLVISNSNIKSDDNHITAIGAKQYKHTNPLIRPVSQIQKRKDKGIFHKEISVYQTLIFKFYFKFPISSL